MGSLFGLFGAFHAEACLLTTVPINSWINQLGGLLFELIKDTNPEAPKEVNLNIAANFLIFMVKSAEGVEENAKGRFSPSKWLARVGKPLGQMSGPVEAISQCLGLIPMEQFEISPKSMVSSTPRTRGRRQRSLSVRAPALEPLSPTRLCESAFADDAHQQQSDHRPPLLCGLLRSLWLVLQRHVQSAEAAFHLIELSSSGLLALAKYLTAESTAVTDVEAHAAVVTAFEAFFTLAWHRLQKYLFKSEEAEDSKNQPNEESKPLNLPESAISQMMVFLEAAVCLASSPVSPLDPHNAATKCIGQCASPKPRKSGCCEDLNEENALPPTATTNSSSRQVILGKSRDTIDFTASKAIDGGDEENLTLAEFQRRLRKKSGSHPHQEGDVLCDTSNGSSQISPSQNPPNKSVFGSFLSSRRFGASAGPKLTSPQPSNLSSSLRMPLVGRRRLSLDPREVGLPTTPIKRSVPSSELRSFEVPATTTSDDVKLNSGEVRRRLFSGGVDDANCLCGTPAASTTLSVAQRGKKRAQTNDLAKTSLPNFSELDDSAQFVFIPPPNIASKRMRLTEHQKERRLEQKQAYIPSMYNDLDASHQSLSSQVCNSDSRSSMESSQSFMQYPQPPESKPSSQSLTMPAAVNYSSAVEAPFPIAASVYNAPLPFEETQEKPATETTTGPETGDDQTDYASAKAVPRDDLNPKLYDADFYPKLEVVSTDSKHYDSKEAFEEASVPLHTEPSQNTAPPSSPVALLNHLRNMAAAPSPSSPGLSGSPMVSRATPALLKSPLLGGAMGKRAQKILEMGLAKAAERSKQRQSLPALAKSSTATSPAPVPDDQPGSRPGILRNLTTPRPRTRVSFASQPVVFILNSPSKPSPDEGSQTTNPTKPVSPPSANAHVSASSEANKVKSVVDNQSQGLLQAEFSSPSIEVTPPSHNESGVSPLKSAVIQPALPEEIAMPFSTTANDISKSSSSPPFLPIGSRRRRKSASPRRRDPIDRSSRDALRHSLPNGIAGSFVRPLNCRHPFASVDNDTIAVQEKATMADKNNVDLDSTNAEDLAQSSITMSTKESNADKSQHSTTSETTLLESSQSFDFVATTQEEVEDSVLKSMSTTSVAFDHVKAKAQEVSELESAAATGHNDFVGSSQELNSVDEVLVADTEPEQIANQPMCDSMDTTLAAVDTQEILSNKHGAEEKSTQPKMVELARQTLTTLKSQLSALTTEQKKELLFETLALFKSIIP
ncbi:unnamed protein product [Mesocestoides corti]|uniref:Telomere-associated protein Rif1 N-terminal domain-containing protein n=1 Tax=Mesocestoides corti TaxID=53468 RepID=A0A3P6GR30_MESCO|nr:unnamed protein product [Mesocestoides corti]